jgi:bisphosphoglycerate-dependent phosphoglycerate mutase
MKRLFVGTILVATLLGLIPTLVLAQDTTPPNISALDAAPAQDGSATVSWTTDEPSDSSVEYGTSTSSLDQSASDGASTTSHSLKLTGLQLNTTYYYRVSSTDADNNTANSPPSGEDPARFQMPPAPPPEVPQPWPEAANILAWLNQEPVAWRAGLIFFLGGLTGAAATAFGAVGGLIPGTAGKEEVDRLTRERVAATKRKETYQTEYDQVRNDPNATDAKKAAFAADVQRAQDTEQIILDKLNKAKHAQYWQALPFYLPLGGVFATALAQDVLQALAIGAGWPTVWAAFQLKPEFKDLNQANAEVTGEKEIVERNNATLQEQNAALTQKVAKVEQIEPEVREMQTILTAAVDDPVSAVGTRPSSQFTQNLGRLKILADQVMNRIST